MWDHGIGSVAGEGEVMVGVGDAGIITVAEVVEAMDKELGVEEVAGEDIDGEDSVKMLCGPHTPHFRRAKDHGLL